MSMAEMPGAAACPGCVAGTVAGARAREAALASDRVVQLSLPTVHCAGCISSVERGLLALDGVRDARVNLTQKRARVTAAPDVSPEEMIGALEGLGYEAHVLDADALSASASDRAARDLLMRLGVAGFSMMNVMLLSVAVWSGASDATRDLFHWISAGIALPTIAFSAQPFFRNALSALRVARLNMDVPISLAILLAAAMSLYETASHGEHAYFDAALSLTFFLLAGRYLDQRTRSVARSAAAELAALEVPTALRLTEDGHERVSVKTVAVGDLLQVLPGARAPVDGIVERGQSEIDRSLLTGETEPVAIGPGDSLRAGEINLTGPLTMKAEAVGQDTLLHSLAELVANAEASKSRYNSLADRAAKIYAPAVHLLALFAFIGWMWASGGDVRLALNIAVATLIITCPCALGLAVPAVSTVASGRLFREGLLVKHATALERLAEVDAVVLDKTGTLTNGTPELSGVEAIPRNAFAVAMALAEGSSHPLAQALAKAGRAQGIAPVAIEQVTEVPGHGVKAVWKGREVRLGRADWTGAAPADVMATHLSIEGEAPVSFRFDDRLRDGAEELIAALRDRGLPVTLLSGDTEGAVARFAARLGIADWHAGVLPGDKARIVEEKTATGQRVLMIGDGLNDTASLATAHVSIAPGSALEATRVAADIVLISPNLAHVEDGLRIARSARRRILENFSLAATYNMISIPIALAGLASPLAAALAMSGSSIMVSLNALRSR